ncbi:DUF6090 family protein [Winogradskyella sp.]|uniref:DUF6090 family protein n=1 Tax=Winogradskyella sp. TaxID=1883156 RepID=UPI0026118EF5|nr:DUF6090 family protein [Winogradskyella sp.]
MIKFFRHIRQGLIKENRFSKYLLYAVGEIILVVIGILLALQFNDWKDHRKNLVAEQKILQGLLTEFENAEFELKGDDSMRVVIRNSVSKVLKIKNGELSPSNDFDSIATLLEYIKMYRFYTPSHPQLNDLQSSGKFDMVSSKATKNALLKYLEWWDRISNIEKNAQNSIINNIHPYLSQNCDLSLLSAKNLENQEQLISQFKTMLKDPTFGSIMRLRLEDLYTIIYYSEFLMEDIKTCQETILRDLNQPE